MQKFILIAVMLLITAILFSDEKTNNEKPDDATNDSVKTATSKSDLEKALLVMNYVHAGFSLTGYTEMLGEVGLGSALLYSSVSDPQYFSNPPYKNNLLTAHKILSSIAYGTTGIGMVMSFITFGIKAYNKMPVNLPHFVMAMITTGFYFLELASMILTKYYYDMQSPYALAAGIAHGVISSLLVLSFTVTLITIPVFIGKKKKLGNK